MRKVRSISYLCGCWLLTANVFSRAPRHWQGYPGGKVPISLRRPLPCVEVWLHIRHLKYRWEGKGEDRPTQRRVSPFSHTTEGTGGWGGAEKMKAAALSVESWRCSPNVQMTEGDWGGHWRLHHNSLVNLTHVPWPPLGPLGLSSPSPSEHPSFKRLQKIKSRGQSSPFGSYLARRYFNQ